jgi:hypothetical protein
MHHYIAPAFGAFLGFVFAQGYEISDPGVLLVCILAGATIGVVKRFSRLN